MDDSLKYMNVCCVRRQFNHLGGRGRVRINNRYKEKTKQEKRKSIKKEM